MSMPLDPQGPPESLTPADTPSDPAGYAMVTPHGQGTAPYDIQAPMDDGEITAQFNAANAVAGAGALYPQGPRQAAAAAMLNSAAGYGSGGISITEGFHDGGGDGWPADVTPGPLETPIQGQPNSYPPNTGTD